MIREIADVRGLVDELKDEADSGRVLGLVALVHCTFGCRWTAGAEEEMVRILGMLEFLRADLIRKAEARSAG